VTVRITRSDSPEGTVLRIDGALRAEALGELEASCDAPVPPLTLELEGLRSADEAGLALLRRLAAEGARLVGVSAYMALKLKLDPRTGE